MRVGLWDSHVFQNHTLISGRQVFSSPVVGTSIDDRLGRRCLKRVSIHQLPQDTVQDQIMVRDRRLGALILQPTVSSGWLEPRLGQKSCRVHLSA